MKNSIFFDLGIDTSDYSTNPKAFSARCIKAANELRESLRKQVISNVSSRDELFRKDALADNEAASEAETFFSTFVDGYNNLSDHAKVHFSQLYNEFRRNIDSDISLAAFEAYRTDDSDTPDVDKKTLHQMYIALRKAYGAYLDYYNSFLAGDNDMLLPQITALTGNFGRGDEKVFSKQIYIHFRVGRQDFFTPGGINRFFDANPVEGVVIPTFQNKGEIIDWVGNFEGENCPISLVQMKV